MGNGAKAQQKRERNQKDAKKGPTSQLNSIKSSMTIVCQICRTQFMSTAKPPALTEHAQNKHGKTMADCFPAVASASS